MKKLHWTYLIFLLIISATSSGQSVVDTKHNLSVSGIGTVKSNSEKEICIFCHTPHNSNPKAPLWNRNDPGTVYTVYSSPTLRAQAGQPDGSSILCLSCHDGTIALGSVLSRTSPIHFSQGTMPVGKTNFGNDLSNNHPVSFIYKNALSGGESQLKDPSAIHPPIALKSGKVQCTSCHDPHKNTYSDFLLMPKENSALCSSCHSIPQWDLSAHNTSPAKWNGASVNPWAENKNSFSTVAQNGCENCHNTHNSNSGSFLLKYAQEENNCIHCHNANVAKSNIEQQLNKPYKHNVSAYNSVHKPNEAIQVNNMHVSCSDCHNPHQSGGQTATAPFIKGSLNGVPGINQNGVPVKSSTYEYEICYRCHAGSPGAIVSPTTRMINQNNIRLKFSPSNPSFHAVAGTGVNTQIPSLISPWTTSSKMYCSDCHSSDGNNAPAGPHGSNFPHILKSQYLTGTAKITESPSAYALCYNCHSRTSILNDVSFKGHSKHIQQEGFSCNNCHDPHGIPSGQGNSFNNSNLINFNSTAVFPNSKGKLYFMDLGQYSGKCSLKCHNKDHDELGY